MNVALREKCSYSEFFWSVFSHIRTEYGEIRSISPFSVRMRENTDQKNSKYGYFSRSVGPYQTSIMEPFAKIVDYLKKKFYQRPLLGS